jgi:hypothetical protein
VGIICRLCGQIFPALVNLAASPGKICRHLEVVDRPACRLEMQQMDRKSAVFLVDGDDEAGHDLKKFSLGE